MSNFRGGPLDGALEPNLLHGAPLAVLGEVLLKLEPSCPRRVVLRAPIAHLSLQVLALRRDAVDLLEQRRELAVGACGIVLQRADGPRGEAATSLVHPACVLDALRSRHLGVPELRATSLRENRPLLIQLLDEVRVAALRTRARVVAHSCLSSQLCDLLLLRTDSRPNVVDVCLQQSSTSLRLLQLCLLLRVPPGQLPQSPLEPLAGCCLLGALLCQYVLQGLQLHGHLAHVPGRPSLRALDCHREVTQCTSPRQSLFPPQAFFRLQFFLQLLHLSDCNLLLLSLHLGNRRTPCQHFACHHAQPLPHAVGHQSDIRTQARLLLSQHGGVLSQRPRTPSQHPQSIRHPPLLCILPTPRLVLDGHTSFSDISSEGLSFSLLLPAQDLLFLLLPEALTRQPRDLVRLAADLLQQPPVRILQRTHGLQQPVIRFGLLRHVSVQPIAALLGFFQRPPQRHVVAPDGAARSSGGTRDRTAVANRLPHIAFQGFHQLASSLDLPKADTARSYFAHGGQRAESRAVPVDGSTEPFERLLR
mmetsp:Transcript_173127/g.555118  ORF Transcript_173127/g.555118 Transcript_173127/m.555118 type:complete len:532 (-) Transcript_173127:119-1714(-)